MNKYNCTPFGSPLVSVLFTGSCGSGVSSIANRYIKGAPLPVANGESARQITRYVYRVTSTNAPDDENLVRITFPSAPGSEVHVQRVFKIEEARRFVKNLNDKMEFLPHHGPNSDTITLASKSFGVPPNLVIVDAPAGAWLQHPGVAVQVQHVNTLSDDTFGHLIKARLIDKRVGRAGVAVTISPLNHPDVEQPMIDLAALAQPMINIYARRAIEDANYVREQIPLLVANGHADSDADALCYPVFAEAIEFGKAAEAVFVYESS